MSARTDHFYKLLRSLLGQENEGQTEEIPAILAELSAAPPEDPNAVHITLDSVEVVGRIQHGAKAGWEFPAEAGIGIEGNGLPDDLWATVKFTVEAESDQGDDGIGHYEYGGARGFDSRPYHDLALTGVRDIATPQTQENFDLFKLPPEQLARVQAAIQRFFAIMDRNTDNLEAAIGKHQMGELKAKIEAFYNDHD
jgi:hypothetical protein